MLCYPSGSRRSFKSITKHSLLLMTHKMQGVQCGFTLIACVFFKHSFKMLQMKHIYNQITDAIRSRFSSSRIKNNLFSTFALNIGVS